MDTITQNFYEKITSELEKKVDHSNVGLWLTVFHMNKEVQQSGKIKISTSWFRWLGL
jgi:hypothetical protein